MTTARIEPRGPDQVTTATARRSGIRSLASWFDSWAHKVPLSVERAGSIDWLRIVPFLLLHVACLAVIWVGWSPIAVWVAAGLYVLRMFAITGFYHRYFSHRTYKTSRFWQFMFAVAGNSAVQRGPLWWAAHHRHHHKVSDGADDMHSPRRHGFLKSHVGWILLTGNFRTRTELVPDLMKFPELRFLDRFDSLVPLSLGVLLFLLGVGLEAWAPGLGTNGAQMLVWGFAISTVITSHATFTINSLSHQLGTRRYETSDDSRNNPFLALLTLGEGWHNNHHHYPSSARQGFFWWEYDITYMGLKVMSWLRIVRELKPVPVEMLSKRRR